MNVIDRFLKYVSFETSSDENSPSSPSSPKELLLAEYIKNELEAIGMTEVRLDEYGYVYAVLPASAGCKNKSMAFIAHMDTSPDAPGANIKPSIIRYEGGDIRLAHGVIERTKFDFLDIYKGKDLIVTDGTTLLGADDKAGIAEIVTAMEYLIDNPQIPHGKISICFTPDEEISRGTDHFDFEHFDAEYGYTVDGGRLGELEYENFNAASATITINGVNIHPGSAKDKMKNAVLVANEFINLLPPAQAPAHTEAYEGFYHVSDINGCESSAKIGMIIRDHDMNSFEKRKKFVSDATAFLNLKYGEGTVVADINDSYYNMKEKIEPFMWIIDKAKDAMRAAGVEPSVQPIRGGTDGARLSYEGLPCPNLSTGGENFHGVHEFACVQSIEKMVEIIINLCK